MFRKIAVKTVLLFLLISIAPISILSYISLQKAQDALKKSIMNSFANLAEEKAQAIRHHLEDHQFEAQALASRPEVKEAVRQANLSYSGLENILRLDREWVSTQGHCPEADRIMAAPLSGFLAEYQNSNPESYGEIFVTDAKGATVAMTRVLSDFYQADEAWWISGYGEGKGMSLFDDRGYDQSVGGPVIGTVVPVRDKEEVIGILKINHKIGGVLEIVERTSIGGSDLVFLGRSSGTIAAMSKQRDYELTDLEKGLLKEKKSGITEDLHNGKKTIMAYAHVETPILTRVRQSTPVKGTPGEKWEPGKWTLFIEMDQEEAFAPIAELKQTIRIAVMLAIAIVVLPALFFSSRITSPIRELIRGAKILGDGDLSHHVLVKIKDEIGELAGAFNKMAVNLKTITASREELEKEVAERKLAEDILRKSEAKYRSLFDNMLNGFAYCKILLDENNRPVDFVYLEANNSFERITGLKKEDIMGKRVTEAIPGIEEAHPELFDIYGKTALTGIGGKFDIYFKPLKIWLAVSVYSSQKEYFVAVFEDITWRKKAEESERQNREKMAHLDRLKSLGTLASGIGHEINNPNNFILMNTTLVREIWDDAKDILSSYREKIPGEIKLGGLPFDKALKTFPQLIEDMRQGSVRIKEIVSNLRDFAVTGQPPLHETVNLRDIIQSSESLTRNLIQKSTRRFSLDIGDLPAVRGNFQRLEQVMVNLITNACHSLTGPGQAVEIKAFSGMDKGMVYVIVRDEGMGMDQETLNRVVEPHGKFVLPYLTRH
ncbi:MAG: HAMP domain-containing protein [Nitrospinae bacterium]|nr:HAMP domain-containing protein [Nitrospinota bacterium]